MHGPDHWFVNSRCHSNGNLSSNCRLYLLPLQLTGFAFLMSRIRFLNKLSALSRLRYDSNIAIIPCKADLFLVNIIIEDGPVSKVEKKNISWSSLYQRQKLHENYLIQWSNCKRPKTWSYSWAIFRQTFYFGFVL